MYDEVLFPTDGSDGSLAALDHAIDLAEQYGARLHVLYVADTTRDSVTTVRGEVVDALVTEGEGVVDDVAATVHERSPDLAVRTDVAQGRPYRAILDYVDDRGADVVVMATHGRTGLDRFLLGSVTERVVRGADVPVLTVRRGVEGEDENEEE